MSDRAAAIREVMDEVGTSERAARVVWAHLSEPADGTTASLLALHGALGALQRLVDGELGTRSAALERLAALDLAGVRRGHEHHRIRTLIPGDAEWPLGVDDLAAPPPCLFVQGDLDLAELHGSIAIVGARASTAYGTQVARGIAAGVAERAVPVVSGAAFGIDAAAHEGALSVDGVTVAVLACGLDRPYPAAHAGLIRRIAGTGAVISEVPLGHAPYRQRFLSRNRLIAAMTVGTVVVEAGPRSGSLNTAKEARDLERHVAMVPGPVTSMMSAGCHDWIRTQGASLVTDAADVLDLMGRLGLHMQDARRGEERPEDVVQGPDRDLWSAVPVRTGATLAELVRAGGRSVPETLAGLGRLASAGLVVRHEDRWRKVPQRKVQVPKVPQRKVSEGACPERAGGP